MQRDTLFKYFSRKSTPDPEFKEIKVYPDGRCLFRCIAAHGVTSLRSATRSSLGCPLDDSFDKLETNLADRIRAEVVAFLKNQMKTLKPLECTLPFILDKNMGHRYKSLDNRLQAMIKPGVFAGYLEIMAVAFLAKIQVHVYKRDKLNYKLSAKLPVDMNESRNPVCVIYRPDTTRQSGHYDLLLGQHTETNCWAVTQCNILEHSAHDVRHDKAFYEIVDPSEPPVKRLRVETVNSTTTTDAYASDQESHDVITTSESNPEMQHVNTSATEPNPETQHVNTSTTDTEPNHETKRVNTSTTESHIFVANDQDETTDHTSFEATPNSKSDTSSKSSKLIDDIGLLINANMSAHDIEKTLKDLSAEDKLFITQHHFKPSSHFVFPSVYMNGYNRSFQFGWLEKYRWIAYSPHLDGAFCIACAIFVKDRVKKGILVNAPFTKWIKASEVLGGNKGHTTKAYHIDAMQAMKIFITAMKNPQATLPAHVNKVLLQRIDNNKHIIERIVHAVLFCGRQCIALRGNNEKMTNIKGNPGNFLAYLKDMAKSDDLLYKHLYTPHMKNATYMSPRSQNELIDLIGHTQIMEPILQEVRRAKYYSIMADEVTSNNKEHMALCLRFVDASGDIREEFLEFVYIERTSGLEIATAIKKNLKKYNLPIENLRGQGYDGAAAMSSDAVGVQARLRQEAPLAVYTHCSGHCLNLVISHSCSLPLIRNMIDKLKETCLFFNYSPKRNSLLKEIIKHDVPNSKKKQPLLNLCQTRWAERHDAYDHFHRFYPHIITCLEIIAYGLHHDSGYQENLLSPWSPDTKKRASSLLGALTDFSFIMVFITVFHALSHLEGVTVKLQGRTVDIIQAHKMIDHIKNVYQTLRDEMNNTFSQYYKQACDMAALVDVEPSSPRIAIRQRHRSNISAETPEDYFRRNLAIPFLDHILVQLDAKFSGLSKQSAQLLQLGLVPGAGNDENIDITEAAEMYKNDLPSPCLLPDELKRWQLLFVKSAASELPTSCAKALKLCDRDCFPNIYVLLQLICTLPVTSCECERSASALRRLCTYMRSSMRQERLSALALMHIHYDTPIDVKETVKLFVERHPRRMQLHNMLFHSSSDK